MDVAEYDIVPVAKPRMTQRDKWKSRPCVLKYHAFKDEVRLKGLTLPLHDYHVVFVLPMPKSWSQKRRQKIAGTGHQCTPDKDNLEKALLDAVFADDSMVWDGRVTKLWGYVGRIIVMVNNNPRNIGENYE